MNTFPLLRLEELSIAIDEPDSSLIITDGVSFQVEEGQLFALVGESGCGKTVTAQAVLRLLPVPKGRVKQGAIFFQGRDILKLSSTEIQGLRGNEISIIFQEPLSSLNPLMPIRQQLEEAFTLHPLAARKKYDFLNISQRCRELLKRMAFAEPDRVLDSYPHQLSGGMLQRVMIAMALLLRPKLLIADEPTTALDVTVQAQIMELLLENCREEGIAILFITHNLGLVAQYADHLAVMYAGRIVESGSVQDFFTKALHPYSLGLLRAFPDIEGRRDLQPIRGQVASPQEYEEGCRFRQRCSYAFAKCEQAIAPPLIVNEAISQTASQQKVACFLYDLPQAQREKKMRTS